MHHSRQIKQASNRMWSRILLISVLLVLVGKMLVAATAPGAGFHWQVLVFGTLKSVVDSLANALGAPVADTQFANLFKTKEQMFFDRAIDVVTSAIIFIGFPSGIVLANRARKLRTDHP